MTSYSTIFMLEKTVKRETLRWTCHGPMAEKRNSKNGNQPTMLAMKSEMLLLTRKIEVKNEESRQAVLLWTQQTGSRYGILRLPGFNINPSDVNNKRRRNFLALLLPYRTDIGTRI